MNNIPIYMLKSVLGVCKFIGYKTCAKFAGLTVGKKAVTYGASYLLGNFVPFRIIKCVMTAAPYAPAAVVLATGGTGAFVANATYIVISQLSEYVFVCAVRTAAWEGTKASYKVAKYVFVTKPYDMIVGTQPIQEQPVDEGWVLVEESEDISVKSRGAIYNLLHSLSKKSNQPPTNTTSSSPSTPAIVDINEEDVNASLLLVTKIAEEFDPQAQDEGIEFVDAEGVVFEEAWDKSVEQLEEATINPKEEEFIMV